MARPPTDIRAFPGTVAKITLLTPDDDTVSLDPFRVPGAFPATELRSATNIDSLELPVRADGLLKTIPETALPDCELVATFYFDDGATFSLGGQITTIKRPLADRHIRVHVDVDEHD